MKKTIALLLTALLMITSCAFAQESETVITLGETILVDSNPISSDASQPIYLALEVQTHKDVPEELESLENRVIVIADAGSYRFSGTAKDAQIAVRAGEDDKVRVILDGVNITCRTAPAIVGTTAYDARVAGEYGLTLELADGSENIVTGSHTKVPKDDEVTIEYDGAIGSAVSLGIEGNGSLIVDADNEGIEVSSGHLTIQSGTLRISACDDPLNVSEDGVGVLTVNGGYVYSSVKPLEGGEGDGIDSNGWIVFNGGTVINLAHPSSMDGGIDSDMGSTINGGLIVGAGNMYDPIESDSQQLFMMLEFGEKTDQLVVVTDEHDKPVFAYDFPYDYMYVAFSTPDLTEGTYRVYLGGEIEGAQVDGLYTDITAYTPGTRMQHGDGTAQMRTSFAPPEMGGMNGGRPGGFPGMPEMPAEMQNQIAYEQALAQLDLNSLLKDADLNELLKKLDLNKLLDVYDVTDLLTDEQIAELFAGVDVAAAKDGANGFGGFGRGRNGGFGGGRGGFPGGGFGGGPRMLESSADTATSDFVLTKDSTGFTNVISSEK